MSKAIDNLVQLEASAYDNWAKACTLVQVMRRAHAAAELSDLPEKKSLLELATIQCEQAFHRWGLICETLDEMERDATRPEGAA